jgi:hypothetical protein
MRGEVDDVGRSSMSRVERTRWRRSLFYGAMVILLPACKRQPCDSWQKANSIATTSGDLGRAKTLGLTYDAKVVSITSDPNGDGVRHETPVKQRPSAALEVQDGWLLGGNRGEWGGELVFVDRSGHPALLFEDNVHAIVRLGKHVIALAGLGHLGHNHGVALEIVRSESGRWSAHPWRVLPGSPQTVTPLRDGRVFIDIEDGSSMVLAEDGSLREAPCTKH